MTLGRFYCCYLRNACDLMPNFHPILFKFCAYVNYMLIYKMHRERKFPKTITNLAALFLELFEPPSYLHVCIFGACELDLSLKTTCKTFATMLFHSRQYNGIYERLSVSEKLPVNLVGLTHDQFWLFSTWVFGWDLCCNCASY